ncbi:MAG TPA: TatD family deoxyribonuclease [Desulfobacteraceae bacterium]|nr:TatD family deoxyribonuclease [Desulfobacteraceae bacterium]
MENNTSSLPRPEPGISLVDTHCHLDMDAYAEDLEGVIDAAAVGGVRRIITVGIDVDSSFAASAIAGRFANVWATVGIHPHHAGEAGAEEIRRIARLAENRDAKVVAYGEIGLDFARNYAPREVQLKAFGTQLQAARELGLPVIIHDRDAHSETLEVLKKNAPYPAGGVMHCFSGDIRLARGVIDELGFFISIPGIVTFNKSDTLQQVARDIPLDHMLLETDGPFLAPVPYRGKINQPGYLIHTARKIAELRGIPLDEVARATTRNAEKLFGLNQESASP